MNVMVTASSRPNSGPWLHKVSACGNIPVTPDASAHEWRRESGWGLARAVSSHPMSHDLITAPLPNAAVKYRITF